MNYKCEADTSLHVSVRFQACNASQYYIQRATRRKLGKVVMCKVSSVRERLQPNRSEEIEKRRELALRPHRLRPSLYVENESATGADL